MGTKWGRRSKFDRQLSPLDRATAFCILILRAVTSQNRLIKVSP